jgi:hypothetical protein
MSARDPLRSGPPVEEGYRLVRDASDRYRRTGNRLQRARKSLAQAERDHEVAARNLRAAVAAVQPTLVSEQAERIAGEQGTLPCCDVYDPHGERPIHSDDCTRKP